MFGMSITRPKSRCWQTSPWSCLGGSFPCLASCWCPWESLHLWLQHPALSLARMLLLLLSLSLISICLPFIRIHVIIPRAHLNNPGQSFHLRILNLIITSAEALLLSKAANRASAFGQGAQRIEHVQCHVQGMLYSLNQIVHFY